MAQWWWAACKSCDTELAIRPSDSTPEKLDLGGMGSVKNPRICPACNAANYFGYADLHEAPRKDDPYSPD